MHQMNISDAELRLMEAIWEAGEIRAASLADQAKRQMHWSRNTTYTLLSRLIEKGAIMRKDPGFSCSALVTRESVQAKETSSLINKLYSGSRRLFLASFLERESLTTEEIEEIRRIISQKEE